MAHIGQELALGPARGLRGFLGLPQRVLGALALDGDPGHVRRGFNEGEIVLVRLPRIAVIDRHTSIPRVSMLPSESGRA